jgi:hypothetical protein
MYQLMLRGPPPPPRAYRSSNPFIRGPTYGPALEKANYSDKLIMLILSCLCEHPKHRPDIGELHAAVLAGVAFAMDNEREPDEEPDVDAVSATGSLDSYPMPLRTRRRFPLPHDETPRKSRTVSQGDVMQPEFDPELAIAGTLVDQKAMKRKRGIEVSTSEIIDTEKEQRRKRRGRKGG